MKVEALVSHEAYNSYIRKRRLSQDKKKDNDSDDGSDEFQNQVFEDLGERRTETTQNHDIKKMNTMGKAEAQSSKDS